MNLFTGNRQAGSVPERGSRYGLVARAPLATARGTVPTLSTRQSHSYHDLVESRVQAQRIEARIGAEPDQALGALVDGLVEQFDRAVVFAQADVDQREMEWRGAPLSRRPLQFINHPQGVLALARFGVGVSEFSFDQRASGRQRKGFLKLWDGLVVFALQIVAQRQVT